MFCELKQGALMKIFFLAFSAVTFLFCTNVYAEGYAQSGWGVSAGAGFIVAPSYLGDNDYQLMAVPNIRVTYQDKFFASVQDGLGYNVIKNQSWRAGPIVRYDFGRDEDGDSAFSIGGNDTDDLRGLGDVDGTAELGGFIEYTFRLFSAKLELRQGVGGHEGLVGDASLSYKGRIHMIQKPVMYSLGPDIKFADSNYHEAYFGVDAGQASRSGLAQYDADAGVLSYGFGGSMIVPMNRNLSTIFFASYSRLGDEAGDSSLVEQRGSRDQGTAGLFVNYSF
jgi:outer membrane protein